MLSSTKRSTGKLVTNQFCLVGNQSQSKLGQVLFMGGTVRPGKGSRPEEEMGCSLWGVSAGICKKLHQ